MSSGTRLMPQRFLVDTAGTFEIYPYHGRPDSAPNIVIKNPDGTTLQASTAMTMASATTTSATGPTNKKFLTLTAVTGFNVGERAYLKNNLGQIEYADIASVNSSTKVVGFEHELRFTYASGDTVAPHRVTYSLTTTHTDTAAKGYTAIVSYSVGSVAKQEKVLFHVRNNVFVSRLQTEDLFDTITDLNRSIHTNSLMQVIRSAFEELYMDLEDQNLDLDRFRSGFFETVHKYRTILLLARRWLATQPDLKEFYDEIKLQHDDLFKKMTDRIHYYDANDDNVVDSTELSDRTGYQALVGSEEYDNPTGADVLTDDELIANNDPQY